MLETLMNICLASISKMGWCLLLMILYVKIRISNGSSLICFVECGYGGYLVIALVYLMRVHE